MYGYEWNGQIAASTLGDLPLPRRENPEDAALLLLRREAAGRTAFCPSNARQLTAVESVTFLDPQRLEEPPLDLPAQLRQRLAEGQLTAVNTAHPRWADALRFLQPAAGRKRVHLLAAGDVGSTVLIGLKLLGGDVLHSIGVCDLNPATVRRWVAELGQVDWPWSEESLPAVEAVEPEHLFDCDVFLFAATRAIPPVGADVKDVRMAQLDANRPLVERFARQARQAQFRGLFLVMSDPVDPLCKAAYLASNTDETGRWDGQGLLAEQVQGLGLGVMNARAAYYARQDFRFASFLTEGRSFGPHGRGLVIANSIDRYDDALSRELTQLVEEANLRIRDLGFKPYVAPALSSGAFQLLLLLRGQWHCGSVCLGEVWFGCRNRYTPYGLETEALSLPDALYDRLTQTERQLRDIL